MKIQRIKQTFSLEGVAERYNQQGIDNKKINQVKRLPVSTLLQYRHSTKLCFFKQPVKKFWPGNGVFSHNFQRPPAPSKLLS